MFGRSQSGPGGLSINTSSANAFSSNSSQPPPSAGKPAGSLFGSLTTSQPQQSTSVLQSQQPSSLFGNLSQPQQSGGLFGSSNQAGSDQQQQGSSIFGGASTHETGGGLFGSQQSKNLIGGGLFGSSNAQTSQPQQGRGLFGSLGQNQAQNQSQQEQSSLFGGFNGQNKTSSLFGNTPNQQRNQQQATMQQRSVPRLPQIGQQMQQQMVPGVKLSVNELRGTTRFNDLHEELQKVIENVDNFILNQIKLQEDCLTVSPKIENTSSQMAPDVGYCTKSLETIQNALENDAESIAFAKNLVKTDAVNAKLSFRAIQNLKQPSQFHQTDLWTTPTSSYSQGPSFSDQTAEEGASRNIVEYFSKQAEEMTRTLDTYKRNITKVETYLKGVESNTMQQMQQMMFSRARDGGGKGAEDQVRELAAVLRDFEAGIMGVAAKVGSAREQVQEVMLGPTEAVGTRSRRYGMP